jgi:sugar phosphate permease
VLAIGLIWGASIVADSAQFSAIVTEVAPPHAVGTALALQTSAGFLLTAFAIAGTSLIRDLAGWGIAFSLLAAGPALGIAALRRLQRLRRDYVQA